MRYETLDANILPVVPVYRHPHIFPRLCAEGLLLRSGALADGRVVSVSSAGAGVGRVLGLVV
jgi:hypothetical protein